MILNREAAIQLDRHAQALRGLACALVGPGDAEDLVQDTAVRALSDTTNPRSWRAWLATIMRNLASNRRQAEQRRTRRESAGGSDGTEPSAMSVAARLETMERLQTALTALPAPYRDALVLRYFDGLTPTAIAARTGKPVATVKSQLQRGLTQLRERLGAGDRADDDGWRAGIALAFGLEPPTGAAAVTGAVTGAATAKLATLGALALMWKTMIGIAVAIALVVWWWPDTEVAPHPTPNGAAENRVAAAAEVDQSNDETGSSPLQRSAAPADESTTQVQAGPSVTFLGRCVDETGAPLADVDVELLVKAWRDSQLQKEERTTTGPDGRFAITGRHRDEDRLELTLRAAGRMALEGSFHETTANDRIDLGDLLVPLPCEVIGRVVDEDGVPQSEAALRWQALDTGGRKQMRTHRFDVRGDSGTDGAFAFTGSDTFAPGLYGLRVEGRELLRPRAGLRIEPGERSRTVEVVVARRAPPCRGIAVDPTGAPIASAGILIGNAQTLTSEDGRFELRPSGPSPDDSGYRVTAAVAGYERGEARWSGDPDETVRLVLEPMPGITLRVVDGQGRPIPRFAVWLLSEYNYPFSPTVETKDHPNGRAYVTAQPGKLFACVEVPSEPVSWSAVTPIEVVADLATERTIVVGKAGRRHIVVRQNGVPLPDVQIALVDRGGLSVTPGAQYARMRERRSSGPEPAHLLQTAVTDADGSAALAGPAGPLAVVLSGAGLTPQTVEPVDLNGAGDLVIDAAQGGVIRGRLVPATVAQQLLRLGEARGNAKRRQIGLRLAGPGHSTIPAFGEPPLPFDENGAFELRAMPGTWTLNLHGVGRHALADLTFGEGATVARTFDVSHLAPAIATLRISIDGEPAANAFVNVVGNHGRDHRGRPRSTQTMQNADSNGIVVVTTMPGELVLHISRRTDESDGGLRFSTAIDIARAGEQALDVTLRTGALDLRLESKAGDPVANRAVFWGSQAWQQVGSTDAEGRLRTPWIAGSYTLSVWPADLTDNSARHSFSQANGRTALDARRIILGEVIVQPGAASPTRLTVPE